MDPLDHYLAWKREHDEEMGCNEETAYLPRATDAEVDSVEAELGIKLPTSYRKVVTSTSLQDGDELLYPASSDARFSILDQPDLPTGLVAFAISGSGDQVCFDTRTATPGSEYPVVLWRHDADDEETGSIEPLDDDFTAYLTDFMTQVHGYQPPKDADA